MQCNYTNEITKSHAVVFRARKIGNYIWKIPRIPEQLWIFWETEVPPMVGIKVDKYNYVFNLTATFTQDSDIPIDTVYGLKNCVRNKQKWKSLQNHNFAVKKRSDVIITWFVSHCGTQSKRYEYVQELQKHIKVDIYGKCGDHICKSRKSCDQQLLHGNGSYKFYLSFENSFCDEYVTEKLLRTLDLDVVPIVMGLANYSKILPPDSFIDVRDFKSPRDLAHYLLHLNRHDKLYNQYLRNKGSLDCFPMSNDVPWECKLCQYLHKKAEHKSIVHNLSAFWGTESRCVSPEIYYNITKNSMSW